MANTKKIVLLCALFLLTSFTQLHSWAGVEWGPESREDIMNTANAMRDSKWTPSATFTNYGWSGGYNKTYYAGTIYTGVPYTQGNPQDSLSDFLLLIRNTSGGWQGSGYGNDCSGFASICWRLPSRNVTSTFGSGIGSYWDSLGPNGSAKSTDTVKLIEGDALNSVSGEHIILFNRYISGGIESVEQTPWNVQNRIWKYASLEIYRPLRRKSLTDGTSGPVGDQSPDVGGGGGGDSEPEPPLPPEPDPDGGEDNTAEFDFRLKVEPSTGQASIGGSVSAKVTATLISGTSRSVNFSVLDLPAGVIANSLAPLNPTGDRTLTFNVASGTPEGDYYIIVRASGGNSTLETSYILTVKDTTPPATISKVNDGLAADIDLTSTVNRISANWTASSDRESGIESYYYAVGTTAGGTNVINWTNNGTDLSVNIEDLSLNYGQTYYFSVKAKNGSGLYSTPKNSDGMKVDSLPAGVTVNDGLGADIDVTKSNSQLSANWTASGGCDSGISMYWYAVGTTQGGTDVVGWKANSLKRNVTIGGLSLTDGQKYYFSVKIVNGVGLETVSFSDGITIDVSDVSDVTAPSSFTVYDGAGTDIDVWSLTDRLSANWDDAADPESGISKYMYAIGTTPGGINVVGWTDNGMSKTVNKTGLSLISGTTYYFTVKAINGVNLETSSSSDGVMIDTSLPADTTPPSAVFVNEGLGQDVDVIKSSTTVSANWTASNDPESGILNYMYAIGTSPGASGVLSWTNNDRELSATVSGLNLYAGTSYYFSVKAINGVGLETVSSADGFMVEPDMTGSDWSPPSSITVNDGLSGDIDITKVADRIFANWSESVDPESGIIGYWYCVGTTQGGADIAPWTFIGSDLVAVVTGLSLSNGTTYYFTVKAENGVGLASVASSDGILVDTGFSGDATSPSDFVVADGTDIENDVSVVQSTCQLSASWTESYDPDSGISTYYYAIGTSSAGIDVVNWTNAGLNLGVTVSNLSLNTGATYYFSVKSVNGTGLQKIAYSDGARVDVDTTPPVAVTVSDGLGLDIDITRLTTELSANWTNSFDPETGISKYMYAIGTTYAGTEILNWTDNGTNLMAIVKNLSLIDGQKYYFSVKSINGKNLGTISVSDGITVNGSWSADLTPPICGIVNDGPGADINWTRTTNQMSANWAEATDPESGVVRYHYAIGMAPESDDIYPWTNNGLKLTATVNGLNLSDGYTYYFNVRVVNGEGLYSYSSSINGITVDLTPPVMTELKSDTHPENVWLALSTPTFSWTGEDENWVQKYYYILDKTQQYTPEQVKASGLTTTATFYAETVSLTSGIWYFHIVPEDSIGNISTSVYTCRALIDVTPPEKIAIVNDGPGIDVDSVNSLTALSANWVPAVEPESGIKNYWYAIGSAQGAIDVVAWSSTTLTSAVASGLALTPGSHYYFSVKAENNLGMVAESAYSDGVVIDTITPTASIKIWPDLDGASNVTVLKTGRYIVELQINEENKVSGIPTLEYRLSDGNKIGLSITGYNEGKNWRGYTFIESFTPQGNAEFLFTGSDEAGNTGDEIILGKTFNIDTTIYSSSGGIVNNSDNSGVQVPIGASDKNLDIVITTPDMESDLIKRSLLSIIDDKGIITIKDVNLYREFVALDAGTGAQNVISNFANKVTITLPYPDDDQDGIVDGTNIKEETLKVFYLNEITEKFIPVENSVIDSLSNYVTVAVDHFSIYVLMSAAPPVSVKESYAYPNPCYLKKAPSNCVKIANLPIDNTGKTKIYIYNLAGESVRTLEQVAGEIETAPGVGSLIGKWDGRNDSGQKVASGIYIYLVKGSTGKKTEKIAIFW